MKRLFVIILALTAFDVSYAQTQKGSFLVGSGISANHAKSEANYGVSKQTRLSFGSKLGYFVIDNLSIGASLPVYMNNSITEYDPSYASLEKYESKATSFGIGPFLRYYVPLNKLQFITEIGYSWLKTKNKITQYDPATGESSWEMSNDNTKTFTASSGFGIFLNRNIAIELLLNYQKSEFTSDNEYIFDKKENYFSLSAGFQIYLHKKTAE